MTVAATIQRIGLADEKALRLHSAQNAPQSLSSLRAQIQSRLRGSEILSKMPSWNTPMRMWVQAIDSSDAKIRAGTQRSVRKALDEGNEVLRMRLRDRHSGFRPPAVCVKAFRERPQCTQSGNRSLACSSGIPLCLRMRQADQADPPSVEARRSSLHLGSQPSCTRQCTLRVEGRLLASQTPCGESQSLSSLATSSSQEGSLYLPEVRCKAKSGSGPYGRLFGNRRPDSWRLSSHPRSAHTGNRDNPLPGLPSGQARNAAAVLTSNGKSSGTIGQTLSILRHMLARSATHSFNPFQCRKPGDAGSRRYA